MRIDLKNSQAPLEGSALIQHPAPVRLRRLPHGRPGLVQGADLKGGLGIFQIDTHTGDVSSLRLDQPGGPWLKYFSLSPDGRSLYVSQALPDGKGFALIQQDLATGSEKELMRRPL